jgi:biotin transport system substrate-specific component
MSTRNLVFASIFTAITAVCAQIFIQTPFSPVPVTLQTLAVFLAGAILGDKLGAISQLVYVLLGTIGIPVFSGLSGGLNIVIGIYGGYIIAFPIAAYIIGRISHIYKGKSMITSVAINIVSMLIGLFIIYLFGVLQYSLLTNVNIKNSALLLAVPFIIPDLMKLGIAAFISHIVKRSLIKVGII